MEFTKGDTVVFNLDQRRYTVAGISGADHLPGERLILIQLAGRWPWPFAITHLIPASLASEFLVKMRG
jgi:hypothetical protein